MKKLTSIDENNGIDFICHDLEYYHTSKVTIYVIMIMFRVLSQTDPVCHFRYQIYHGYEIGHEMRTCYMRV